MAFRGHFSERHVHKPLRGLKNRCNAEAENVDFVRGLERPCYLVLHFGGLGVEVCSRDAAFQRTQPDATGRNRTQPDAIGRKRPFERKFAVPLGSFTGIVMS